VSGEPIAIPIDGTLDLHNFRPREIGDLVPNYLEECRARGIFEVRIIHGKGTGALRRSVLAVLERLPYVERFVPGGTGTGEWGVTRVSLRCPDPR
jgi:dsDNA-specific endonuclease/ATPase MutS2